MPVTSVNSTSASAPLQNFSASIKIYNYATYKTFPHMEHFPLMIYNTDNQQINLQKLF